MSNESTAVKNKLQVTQVSEREFLLTRTFNAPRELVWQVLTRPEHISRWWGPREMGNAQCEMDFREGGGYRFVSHAPDGQAWAFFGEYREIVPPSRVVQTFGFEGMPGQPTVETMTLEEHDGKTTLRVHCQCATVEDCGCLLDSDMEKGAGESYDRLEELLAELS